MAAPEKAKRHKEAHGEVESHRPGYPGSQDTCDAGTMKGAGRIYRRTFVTCARAAIAAPNLSSPVERPVVPFFAGNGIRLPRIPTGAPNGKVENHACRLYLAVEGEFHDIAFRKKLYRSVEALQTYLGCLAGQIQRSETAFRKILPWQDTCADPPRNAAHCRGQDRKRFRTGGQSTSHSRQCKLSCPSDRAQSFTPSPAFIARNGDPSGPPTPSSARTRRSVVGSRRKPCRPAPKQGQCGSGRS